MPTIAFISLIGITLYQLIKFLRDKIEKFDSFIKKYFGRIDFFNVAAYTIVAGISIAWSSFLITCIKDLFN
jgi:hypothetical protein